MVINKLYQWLWTKIGGRPWTDIIQDTWHKLEGIWILCLVAVGAILGHYLGLITTIEILGVFCVGYIFGHLFWGKPWIDNQGIK